MQLRLGSPRAATEHPGYLFVLVALNVMKNEYRAIPWRKLRDRILEAYAVDDGHRFRIKSVRIDRVGHFAVIGRQFGSHRPLAKMHKNLVNGQPMKPGRKCRLAAKRANLAMELNEYFLREIFGFGNVARHSQAYRVDPSIV